MMQQSERPVTHNCIQTAPTAVFPKIPIMVPASHPFHQVDGPACHVPGYRRETVVRDQQGSARFQDPVGFIQHAAVRFSVLLMNGKAHQHHVKHGIRKTGPGGVFQVNHDIVVALFGNGQHGFGNVQAMQMPEPVFMEEFQLFPGAAAHVQNDRVSPVGQFRDHRFSYRTQGP